MRQVIDKNSGQVLFVGPEKECVDFVVASKNEFAELQHERV